MQQVVALQQQNWLKWIDEIVSGEIQSSARANVPGRDRRRSSRRPCGPGSRPTGPPPPAGSHGSGIRYQAQSIMKIRHRESVIRIKQRFSDHDKVFHTQTSAFLDSAAYSMASLNKLSFLHSCTLWPHLRRYYTEQIQKFRWAQIQLRHFTNPNRVISQIQTA